MLCVIVIVKVGGRYGERCDGCHGRSADMVTCGCNDKCSTAAMAIVDNRYTM